MSEQVQEVRRIARRARRMGLAAETMGMWNDVMWKRFRVLAACADVPNLWLADAVDRVKAFEEEIETYGMEESSL